MCRRGGYGHVTCVCNVRVMWSRVDRHTTHNSPICRLYQCITCRWTYFARTAQKFSCPLEVALLQTIIQNTVPVASLAKLPFKTHLYNPPNTQPILRRCVPGGLVTTPYISAPRQDRNEMSTATPMFAGARNPTVLLEILSDVTLSLKSKMVASNLEIRICRLVDMIATKFQRLPACFWGQGIQR